MKADLSPLHSMRCRLTLLEENDDRDVLDMFGDEGTFIYIPHLYGRTESDYLAYLEDKRDLIAAKKGFYWVGRDQDNNDLIGCINVTPIPDHPDRIQIGWQVRSKFWRQGYATELAHCVFNWVLEQLQISSIFGVFDERNVASKRILKRLGFAPFERYDTTLVYRFVKGEHTSE